MNKKESNNGVWVIAIVVIVAFLSIIFVGATSAQREATKKKCEKDGQVYVESSNTCREKTIPEKFSEQCVSGIDVGDRHYSCKEIHDKGLEEAYVNNKTIIRHGDDIYEKGTILEVTAGKRVGDYCISASETWGYIGEKRCVVFTPTYFARQGYNYFLDEKQNYTDGFVVYMYGNYGWNWFLNTYKDKGPILVCGTITTYQGHPQIKTTPSGTLVSPQGTADGSYTVYKYSCN